MTDKGACIVTGGASGIGFASARELLKQGWRVALFDIHEERLQAARAELAADEGVLTAAALDITNASAVELAVARLEETFAPVRGVVNSAGIARDTPFLETGPEMFRQILEVNVIGSFIVARAAARAMAAAERGGAVVNLASVAGLRGSIGRTAYGASKGAVITMTKVMAVELAPRNIRVNAVAPGPVDTPLVEALHSEEIRAKWLRTVPLRRYAQPSEIASAIAFLLDAGKAAFITGQILAVDGGFDAGGLLVHG